MNYGRVCTKLGIRDSKAYWNCTTWIFIRRNRIPIIKSCKPWCRGVQIRNFVYETLMPDVGKLNVEPWERVGRELLWLKEEKVPVTSGKKKGQCSQGDCCSFRHVTQDRAQKPEHTAATPSEPTVSRGRSVSEKRSIRGKSNRGSIARQPCRYYLKGTCTRTLCECWHPPECQFLKQKRVVRRETRVCFLITKLMNNKTKGWKKTTSQKIEKVKTKALWLSRKAYHNWVVYHRTRMHSFLKEQKSFGETRCRKSWTQFEKFDSLSPRCVKRVFGKRKDHRWEKQSRSSSAKSLRSKIRGSVPRRDWTTTAMYPKQGSCQKYLQAQRVEDIGQTK